jgi:hypothetical protein
MEGLKMKYFVLNPHSKNELDIYAEASRKAMRAYARHIKIENEELANDLIKWADAESKVNEGIAKIIKE